MRHAEPVTEQPDSTPPRRRRRAARRAAGPPSVGVARSEPDPFTTDPGSAAVTAEPHVHRDAPHVPGPGHGPGAHRAGGARSTADTSGPPAAGVDPASGNPAAGVDGVHAGAGTGGPDQRRPGRSAREEATERSLRSLVTTRSSQVSPVAAMRAREVALPTAADLAAAEAEVTLVRRHYVPPTALTAGRKPDRQRRRSSDNS